MLVKHLPVGYANHQILVDEEGEPVDSIIIEVNQSFEDITGLNTKAVVGKKATELHAIFKDPVFERICEHGRNTLLKRSNNFEHYFKKERTYCSIRIVKSEPGYFSTFYTDITEKKTLQEQNNFELLFRNNPALMALTTLPDRRFVAVNDAFLKTLGYTKEEITGKSSQELGIFANPAQIEIVAKQIKEKSKVEDFEIQVRCKDGTLLDGIFFRASVH